jgi:regulator of protease activity HflC (stomatin/prohibitin superfamily)
VSVTQGEGLPHPPPGVTASAEQVRVEAGRVVERLRTLSQARLLAPVAPYASRVEAARTLAQALAEAAATLEAPAHAVRRKVPDVGPFAVGDQVAVTAHDLLLAAAGAAEAADVLDEALGRLRAVRRLL